MDENAAQVPGLSFMSTKHPKYRRQQQPYDAIERNRSLYYLYKSEQK